MRNSDCVKKIKKITAEALRAQRKPNEAKLTSKNYRNTSDVKTRVLFSIYYLRVLCVYAVRNKFLIEAV